MHRFALAFVGILAGTAVLAPSAHATYHLEMVNEVMLAGDGGDTTVQFVELFDPGGASEPFPPTFGPYRLAVYDAAGTKLGEQALSADGLRAAAMAGREYLLSTPGADVAFGVMADEVLQLSLPAGAGQACFEGSPQPPAVSCLTWGEITNPVPINSNGTGSFNGPAPPDGQSAQRQPNGDVVIAEPTPRAPNRTDPGGGGSPPFAGVTVASRAPVADGRARVRIRCPEGSGGCSGNVRLAAARDPQVRFGSAPFDVPDGRAVRVGVPLTAAARRRLADRRRVKARATARARDSAGQSKRTRAAVTLVRPKR
jgi:hypothetical protein